MKFDVNTEIENQWEERNIRVKWGIASQKNQEKMLVNLCTIPLPILKILINISY